MNGKKYTIKDIAQLAGVSKGTVDRVLHRRGKVSKKAQAQVERVLEEIDYRPNPVARNLRINKVYEIAVLLPSYKEDLYWLPAEEGIRQAAEEFKAFGVLVTKYAYHPKTQSFVEQSEEVLKHKPDALLMVPIFHKESLKVYQRCKESGIHVSSFNNHIDALSVENFIGQDLVQSGRVAASLIDKLTPERTEIAIIHIDEEFHMRQKEIGFRDYFKERKQEEKRIIVYNLCSNDRKGFHSEVTLLMESHPHVGAFFVTNSKAHLLVKLLGKKAKDSAIVGYDLLPANLDYLKKGRIDFLIHQKPKRQAYLGVGHLAEYFLFQKEMPPQTLLPIDIITTENFKYYLD